MRVATLNIWHDRGPWPARLPLIRHELARLKPDAIGLQEVLRDVSAPATVDTCQALAIARDTGYHVAYAPAAPRDGRGGIWQGNAVLTPWPIRTRHVVPLPGADEAEPRSLLYTLVQTPLGDLPVFVTHLAWEPHHAPLRLRQVAYVAAHVDALSPPGALPAVLLGDFNAEPDSIEMKYLRDAGFADAWGDAAPGYTFDEANDYVRDAGELSCRIDYILIRGSAIPLDTRLAFTSPDRSTEPPVWPSDHFGVLTDLAL